MSVTHKLWDYHLHCEYQWLVAMSPVWLHQLLTTGLDKCNLLKISGKNHKTSGSLCCISISNGNTQSYCRLGLKIWLMKKINFEISILSPKTSLEHFQQLKFETRETWRGCPNSWNPTYIYSNEKLTNHPHQLNKLKAVDGGQCDACNQHTETLRQDQQQQEDLGPQCWLAKENIEVKEVRKLTNKRQKYKERKTYRWKTSREEVKRGRELTLSKFK
jgi:hypothetical protein